MAPTYSTAEEVLDAVWESAVEFRHYDERPHVNSLGAFGNSPLEVPITWGDEDAVKLLLQAGADPDIRGERGNTALHHAVEMGQFAIVRLLVSHGANQELVNDRGERPRDLCWEGEWLGLFGEASDLAKSQ